MKLIIPLAILTLLLPTAPLARSAPSMTTAKFLAGLPVRDPALAALTHTPGWGQHSALLETKWDKMEQRQMADVRAWAAAKSRPILPRHRRGLLHV
jgi:hypothetical protein